MTICSPQTFGAAGGDMMSFAIPGDLPVDCRTDAGGALLFRTEPLAGPVEILGQPEVQLTVAADRPQGLVAALLVDEALDGAQTLITRGFCNLTHRHGDTAPAPVVPGEKMQVTVPLHGIAHRLGKGHRLMLQIASAYWPILWPAPEPVTLTLYPGTSSLLLPVWQNPGGPAPRPLPDPPPGPDREMTQMREGSMERSVHTDLVTGMETQRVFIDGGVFGPVGDIRLDEIDTVLSDISDRRYTIHPDDPLSARATMEQDARFMRDDWNVRIKTFAEQTATATDFHLTARIECWSDDKLVFEDAQGFTIPRNGM